MSQNNNKDEIIDQIISVFRANGYEGASLSVISKATQLGKSSLYHHFPNGKIDMALAALKKIGEDYYKLVIEPLDNNSKTPFERVVESANGIAKFYADGENSCLIELFSIGEAKRHLGQEIRQIVEIIVEKNCAIAIEAGLSAQEAHENALKAFVEIQGNLVLARSRGDYSNFSKMIHNLPKIIFQKQNLIE